MGRHALARAPERGTAAAYRRAVPPAWLLWLLPVPVATLGAVAWASWTSRARGPQDPVDSVRAHDRFRAAMDKPLPRPSRDRSD